MIFLNDILNLSDIENTKIRFNLMFDGNWEPSSIYKAKDFSTLLDGHYYNKRSQRSYKVGQTTIGFIRLDGDRFLLFHIGKVTRDLNILGGVGYEYESIAEYEKYCGRIIVKFRNTVQQTIRKASSVLSEIQIHEIIPDDFSDDIFPGYENVKLSWKELCSVLCKNNWITALENQKAVYLITDKLNGKMYVGSASGQEMLLGRWKTYALNGHGGNVEFRSLDFDYVKRNFEYSILDIFKSTTSTDVIIKRESWWKDILKTRSFGYNRN